MHVTTLDYLKPTDNQIDLMNKLRQNAKDYLEQIEMNVPDGPDKTYLIRKLREVNMWAMIAITRQPDGSPRG